MPAFFIFLRISHTKTAHTAKNNSSQNTYKIINVVHVVTGPKLCTKKSAYHVPPAKPAKVLLQRESWLLLKKAHSAAPIKNHLNINAGAKSTSRPPENTWTTTAAAPEVMIRKKPAYRALRAACALSACGDSCSPWRTA